MQVCPRSPGIRVCSIWYDVGAFSAQLGSEIAGIRYWCGSMVYW
jgi:hypothetical protein